MKMNIFDFLFEICKIMQRFAQFDYKNFNLF